MIALLAAAISFATIDAPHHGKAFVVASDLAVSRLMTSGDAIGCSSANRCPDAVYVRFADQPGLRYPAIVWKPFGASVLQNSVQMLTVVRGELTPLQLAESAAIGDAVSIGACAPSPASGTYIASVAPGQDSIRTTVPTTPAISGCPLIAGSGVAGLVVPDVEGLSANPGPRQLASLYQQVTQYVRPSYLPSDPRADAEQALLTATYPTDSSAMYVLQFNAPAVALCKRADSGDAAAAFGCAQAFLHGYGAPRDVDRALPYLRLAAAHDVRASRALLAQWEPAAARDASAFAQTLAAAQRGDPAAMRTAGEDYRDGRGVAQNPVVAFGWFQKAADAGDANGRSDLMFAYARGSGVIQDDARAAQLGTPLVAATPASATASTADLYQRAVALAGSGDVLAAANAYIAAAKSGDPQIEYAAAMFFGHTYGVEAKLTAAGMIDADERSDQYLDDAVKKRYWKAEWLALGGHVSVPIVISPNPQPHAGPPMQQVIADTLPAANAHDQYAEQQLAAVYLAGNLGVPRDCAKGITWATRALAEPGIPGVEPLAAELGGTPYDRPDAESGACLSAAGGLDLMRALAQKGSTTADWRLATLYETGRLVPKDLNEATRYYRLAAPNDLISRQWLEAHGAGASATSTR